MHSEFSASTLAEIFRDLFVCERTGVLILTHDELEKRVHFDRGLIAFAESPLAHEDLGPCLVESGRISAGALVEAEASIEGIAETTAIARSLVRRDLIGRASIAKAMREIVARVVRSVFAWEGGGTRFEEGGEPEGFFEGDVLGTVDVILQGISTMAGFDRIFEAMRGLDNRLRLRETAGVPVDRLPLTAAQGFILSRVDGNTGLADLISILPPDEEEAAGRFFFGLLVLGVLEYDPAVGEGPFRVSDVVRDRVDQEALERKQEQSIQRVLEQVREGSPHQILDVSPAATRSEIGAAYQRAKAQLERDRIVPALRDRFRSELALIESRLVEAFVTLTQPTLAETPTPDADDEPELRDLKVRVEVDKAKSKQKIDEANRVADSYYAKGRKCRREGDFHNAIQYGKLAISHNPSDARYYSLIADCQSRNPETRWQRMAEENFTRATQLDPWNWEYWFSLGRFYKKQGMNLRAKRKFEEALKLVPNQREILRELASVSKKGRRPRVL